MFQGGHTSGRITSFSGGKASSVPRDRAPPRRTIGCSFIAAGGFFTGLAAPAPGGTEECRRGCQYEQQYEYLLSLCLLILLTFTSQSVVPKPSNIPVPSWPADTGSESASRYLGDSGQIFFPCRLLLSHLLHPYFLSV